jgi:hypothetical protein
MNALLWVLQVVLAVVFAAHGWLLLSPPADLIEVMNETMSTEFPSVPGAAPRCSPPLALRSPGITRIMPWLVPAAAVGRDDAS